MIDSGKKLDVSLSIPSNVAIPWVSKRCLCKAYASLSFRMFKAKSLPSSLVQYKRAASSMFSVSLACSRNRPTLCAGPVIKKPSTCLHAFVSPEAANRLQRTSVVTRRFHVPVFSGKLKNCTHPNAFGAPSSPWEGLHGFPDVVGSQSCCWRRLNPDFALSFAGVLGGRPRCNLRSLPRTHSVRHQPSSFGASSLDSLRRPRFHASAVHIFASSIWPRSLHHRAHCHPSS